MDGKRRRHAPCRKLLLDSASQAVLESDVRPGVPSDARQPRWRRSQWRDRAGACTGFPIPQQFKNAMRRGPAFVNVAHGQEGPGMDEGERVRMSCRITLIFAMPRRWPCEGDLPATCCWTCPPGRCRQRSPRGCRPGIGHGPAWPRLRAGRRTPWVSPPLSSPRTCATAISAAGPVAAWLRSQPTSRQRSPPGSPIRPRPCMAARTARRCSTVSAAGSLARDWAGRTLGVTHAAVVRAAIVHALGAGPPVLRHIDAAPLTLTELGWHAGCWRLRATGGRLGR
ncbi:MAG: histidine phosphatase family protein [Geminicoccaceae bacterium]